MKSTPGPSDPKQPIEMGESTVNTVLIAEDDPIFRRILQSWLKKWNYRVTAVENGLDAWSVLQEKDSPQMVILDWMMPGMDGIELCRRVRGLKVTPYHYVLLLTAKDDKNDVVTGLDAGADDYLTKPFDVDELRARVRAGKRILELQDALLRAQDALHFEAAHDRLTGIWNRGAILDLLIREVERRHRSHEPLGLIMVDVDHFKKINDKHGHLVGDEVLRQVALRLAAVLRSYDSVGRYGGEEFLILLPGCHASDLVASAERLRQCISNLPIETGAGQIPVTLSLGVSSVDGHESPDCETFLRAADAALYRAKHEGRNRVASASVAALGANRAGA